MIGEASRVSLFGLLFLTIACAKPRYVNAPATAGGSSVQAFSTPYVFPQSGFTLWWAWETRPGEEDPGSMWIKIGRPNLGDASPIPMDSDGALKVTVTMPSMGHDSSPVTIERVDVGTYRAKNVWFSMAGFWEVRVFREVSSAPGAAIERVDIPFQY